MRRWVLALLAALGVSVLCGAGWPGNKWPLSNAVGENIFAHIPCSPTFGCNDPNGIILFDEGALTGLVSGLRDDNSSIQCGQNVVCPGVDFTDGDHPKDFINLAGTPGAPDANRERFAVTATAVGATATSLFISNSIASDVLFCRLDNTGAPPSVLPCSVNDGVGNACQDSLSDGTPTDNTGRHMVVKISDVASCVPDPSPCYEMVIATAFAGCNSGSQAALSISGLRKPVPLGSEIWVHKYDETHDSSASARFVSDVALHRSLDAEFTPRLNMLTNGWGEDGCASGWNVGGTGTVGSLADMQYTPHLGSYALGTAASAFRGKACGATFTDVNADNWIETDDVTVEPETWYVYNTMVNVDNLFNTAQIEPLNASNDAVLPTGTLYNCRGRCLKPAVQYNVPGVSGHNWTKFHLKFFVPVGVTSIKLRTTLLSGTVVTTSVGNDESWLFPAVYQNEFYNEQTLFDYRGPYKRIYCSGDSRTDESVTAADPAYPSIIDEYCTYIDILAGIRWPLVPQVANTVFLNSSSVCGGYQAGWFKFSGAQGPCGKDNMSVDAFLTPGGAKDTCVGSAEDCGTFADLVYLKYGHNDIAIGPSGQIGDTPPLVGACAANDPPANGAEAYITNGTYCQQTPAMLRQSMQRICNDARSIGAACFMHTEQQFRGNSSDSDTEALYGVGFTGLCDLTHTTGKGDNCGDAFQLYNGDITRGDGLDGSTGMGW